MSGLRGPPLDRYDFFNYSAFVLIGLTLLSVFPVLSLLAVFVTIFYTFVRAVK